jgi:hypothetical protein
VKKIEGVYVSPFSYEVKYDDQLTKNAGALGATGTDQTYIVLDPSSSRGVLMETLLHECLHAIWTQTALDKEYSDEQEEQVIYTLSPRIMALLRDNPRMVKEWLRN